MNLLYRNIRIWNGRNDGRTWRFVRIKIPPQNQEKNKSNGLWSICCLTCLGSYNCESLKTITILHKGKIMSTKLFINFHVSFHAIDGKKHITTLTIYSPNRCQFNWKTRIRYVSRHNYLMESFQYWRDFLTERFQKICRSVFPIFIDLVIFLSSLSYFDLKIAFFIWFLSLQLIQSIYRHF